MKQSDLLSTSISSVVYIRIFAIARKIPPTTPALFPSACTFAAPVNTGMPVVVELKPGSFTVREGASVFGTPVGLPGDAPSDCPGVEDGLAGREGLFGLLESEEMIGFDGFGGPVGVVGSEERVRLDKSLGVVGSFVMLNGWGTEVVVTSTFVVPVNVSESKIVLSVVVEVLGLFVDVGEVVVVVFFRPGSMMVSFLHVEEHPSPLTAFPSSHSSPISAWTIPSPHLASLHSEVHVPLPLLFPSSHSSSLST